MAALHFILSPWSSEVFALYLLAPYQYSSLWAMLCTIVNPLNNDSKWGETWNKMIITDFFGPTELQANIIFNSSSHSIIRILWMVPIYSVVAWISILFYHDSVYFEVIGNCYEAFCIAAFFSLMCAYIAPDLHSQKDYFRGIQPKTWLWPLNWFQKWACCGSSRGIWRDPRSGLTWFNVSGSSLG